MGLFGGSKSSSSSSVTTNEHLDNSQVQGLAAVRGDGNTVQLLDNDAIKNALAFANRTADGNAKSTGDLLNVFGSLADKVFSNAAQQSQDTIKRMSESSNNVNNAVSSAFNAAYTKAQNSGIDPQMIIFAVLGLGALFLFKK